jgi:hypothetical protein
MAQSRPRYQSNATLLASTADKTRLPASTKQFFIGKAAMLE